LIVRGRWLEARTWGVGEPPVVLLHEGLGSVAGWREFPQQLSQATGRRVFAYSRAGHGRSDPLSARRTPRFMHEEAIDWLPEVLDRAGIARAAVLGHSDGASIALIFAAEFPSRVESLILEAPHVFVEDLSIASIDRARERYLTSEFRERLAQYHDHVDDMFYAWNDVWLSPEFRTWNLEEYLPRITCPTLLIQGEQDEFGTARQVEAIAEAVRGKVEMVMLPDCGHSPHRHQNARTLAAITTFLARESGCRSTAE
jgi:pimeloyl-ACP methyl ester carboxylesterase